MTQKYPIGTIFDGGGEHNIKFRVTYYEESLSDDKDDHYEVCFDEEFYLKCFTKQSYLDKMTIKK